MSLDRFYLLPLVFTGLISRAARRLANAIRPTWWTWLIA